MPTHKEKKEARATTVPQFTWMRIIGAQFNLWSKQKKDEGFSIYTYSLQISEQSGRMSLPGIA